jgi:hypothetical protein
MEEGVLASSLLTADGGLHRGNAEGSVLLYLSFREAIKSAHAITMMRETVAVLFGASAPLISSVAADADQQLLHVEVSGGQRGADQLRAACAMIRTLDAADGKGRISVRFSVHKVTVQ